MLRKTSLLIDCLRAWVKTTPLLLVLEDGHWLDPLSLDLLEVIGRAIVDLPVLMVVAYRPRELQHLRPPWVGGGPPLECGGHAERGRQFEPQRPLTRSG